MSDPRMPPSLLVAGRTGDVETAGLSLVEGDGGGRRVRLVDQVADLRALCSHPERPLVYGVAEHPDGVLILVWDCGTGVPVRVTAVALPLAPDACDVAVSPDGGLLAIVSFGDDEGGAVVLVPLDDDALPHLDAVQALEGLTHPHQAVFLGDELLIPDLGADLVHRWTILGTSAVPGSPIAVPPGTGPRHMSRVRGDVAETVFVVSGELAQSVVRLDIADSAATAQLPSTASTGAARSRSPRNYPGDITRVRNDRAVVTNRGYDTVALFETVGGGLRMLDEITLEHSWPQHLLVDGDGDRVLVACWDSSTIVELEIREDDTLATIGEFPCPGASWLLELPAHATRSRDLDGRRG